MDDAALADLRAFLDETTRRFVAQYRQLQPHKTPLLGFDTDFTPPGDTRDWVYGHERFGLMIQGKNHDPFYITADESIELVKRFNKPFVPQESLDPPGVVHIADIKHKNSLTYFEPQSRPHLRKYVWRWIMARSQLIDIYQKGLSKKVEERERYDPRGHNGFEDDAKIIRQLWHRLTDYAHLGFRGRVVSGPGPVQMVLSSPHQALVYFSSAPGEEGVSFKGAEVQLEQLALADGPCSVELWKPSAPGGLLERHTARVKGGKIAFVAPEFVDDLVLFIAAEGN